MPFVVATLCAVAWPQEPRKDEIDVNITVNYSFAYRAGSWVPVDILVLNSKQDVSGWLEIRTYEEETAESPVYRVPAECPKGSRKRFQVYCYLDQTTRVEVRLYDGWRQIIDFPPWLDVKPIREQDLLGLLLDEDGSGFGFLNEVIDTSAEATPAATVSSGERRLYRETLNRERLSSLAEYPQCYLPYDVVLFGNTDPEALGDRYRDLLWEYVRGGGTLVVCAGEYAAKYSGTWIEELAGAAIAPGTTLSESVLAREAFPPELQGGARDQRDCIVATLTPASPDTKRMGASRVLATRRPLGSGFVYVIAVDADNKSLQGCSGYLALWREILARRETGDLNYENAARIEANILPQISGVVVHSRKSVMMYLGLYFGIGIVANWLFFSWLKRREWAWATLVVFAIGFTAYALIYGTAGRAQSTELQRIEVLRAPRGGGLSELRSCVGILTARSATYALEFENPYTLVRGVANPYDPYYMGRSGRSAPSERPFYFVKEKGGRVEGLGVGASEMRLLQTYSDIVLPGGIGGSVSVTKDNRKAALDLTNETGRAIRNPFVYVDGSKMTFKPGDDAIWDPGEHISIASLPLAREIVARDDSHYYRGMRSPESSESLSAFRQRELESFRQRLPWELLSQSDYSTNMSPYGQGEAQPLRGAFVCGWLAEGGLGAVAVNRAARPTVAETLLVADVDVIYEERERIREEPLDVFIESSAVRGYRQQGSFVLRGSEPAEVLFVACESDVASAMGDLKIQMRVFQGASESILFLPEGAQDVWAARHRQTDDNVVDGAQLAEYSIVQWREKFKPVDIEAVRAMTPLYCRHSDLLSVGGDPKDAYVMLRGTVKPAGSPRPPSQPNAGIDLMASLSVPGARDKGVEALWQ